MGELLARLRRRPGHSLLMVIASILANLMGLASSLYVIQVLNRYVSNGVDSTLATLTVGVFLAILFEFGFRWSRMRLAASVSGEPDYRTSVGAFGVLTTAKLSALEKVPQGERREALTGLEQVESAYSAPNLTAMLDLPTIFNTAVAFSQKTGTLMTRLFLVIDILEGISVYQRP